MGTQRRKQMKARVQRRKLYKRILKDLENEQAKNGNNYDLEQKINYYKNELHRM